MIEISLMGIISLRWVSVLQRLLRFAVPGVTALFYQCVC